VTSTPADSIFRSFFSPILPMLVGLPSPPLPRLVTSTLIALVLFFRPYQPRPPRSVWYSWHLFLQHLTTNHRLTLPLGPWLQSTHQTWSWFLHPSNSGLLHFDSSTQLWRHYQPSTTRRVTRTQLFREGTVCPPPPPSSHLLPVSILSTRAGWFTYSASPNPIPSIPVLSPRPPVDLSSPFYQRLLGFPANLSTEVQSTLASNIQLCSLIACSDGSAANGLASSAWVFSDSSNILWEGSGLVDGHPDQVTSYRAELCGILSVLVTLLTVCLNFSVTSGSVTTYCDNRGALHNAFLTPQPSVSQFFTTDYDILQLIHSILTSCLLQLLGLGSKSTTPDPKDNINILLMTEQITLLQTLLPTHRQTYILALFPLRLLTTEYSSCMTTPFLLQSFTIHLHQLSMNISLSSTLRKRLIYRNHLLLPSTGPLTVAPSGSCPDTNSSTPPRSSKT
jgi:hypothetical protein